MSNPQGKVRIPFAVPLTPNPATEVTHRLDFRRGTSRDVRAFFKLLRLSPLFVCISTARNKERRVARVGGL